MAQAITATDAHEVLIDRREYITVPVADLIVDNSIQRTVVPERVDEIAHHFDWRMFETPTVSRRQDGRLVVIEGQNRVLALKKRSPETAVTVAAINGLSLDDEAALSLWIYKKRKSHTPYQRWQQMLRQSYGVYERFAEAALRDLGLHLGEGKGVNTVACVAAVESIVKGHRQTPKEGADLLRVTLAAISRAFAHDPDGKYYRFDNVLVRAVAEVVRRNREIINEKRLEEVLSSRPLRSWMVQIAERNVANKADTIAVTIVIEYNKGKRGRRIAWES